MEINDKDGDSELLLIEGSNNSFREAMREASIRDLMAIGLSDEEARATVDDIAAVAAEDGISPTTEISAVMNRRLHGQLEMDGPSSQR